MTQWLNEPEYQAYLLRIWKDSGQWRFSIEAVDSGRRQGFACIEQLVAFLEEAAPAPEEKASSRC
jgi:hypothetical protein